MSDAITSEDTIIVISRVLDTIKSSDDKDALFNKLLMIYAYCFAFKHKFSNEMAHQCASWPPTELKPRGMIQ